MKVVIQCAARKRDHGSFITREGRPILFVAHPGIAPLDNALAYARPDDLADDGRTWRARLLAYNNDGANPLRFLPAYRLYVHDAYETLVARFGFDRVYILSAGWGLIPATFLTPLYDITFTKQADRYKRRRDGDAYADFQLMPDDGEDIVFLGGRDYVPLFGSLTASLWARKYVVFSSAAVPALPAGFTAIRYETRTRTNWHYEASRSLIAGDLPL